MIDSFTVRVRRKYCETVRGFLEIVAGTELIDNANRDP
jgi:hypothetical protein